MSETETKPRTRADCAAGQARLVHTGIIFADFREAKLFVRGWREVRWALLPSTAKAYEQNGTVAVIAGMGPKHAAAAARALVEQFSPGLLVSAGFAGAIDERLEPPAILRPARVVNGGNGQIYETDTLPGGKITLVSCDHVVDEKAKRKLAQTFSATAVDMEGATIAEIARAANIPFAAVKAISERADFPMPPFDRFIGADGHLQSAKFLVYAAVHPLHWGPLLRLARDASQAAEALAVALRASRQQTNQCG